MVIDHIVQLLISERDKLSRAIEALGATVKHRGRPGRRAKAAAPVSRRKRKPFTAARRKALSTKMKAYWAKRKKAAKS